MPNKVMTIYAIGTGHSYLEPYNTLVTLCNNTTADCKILSTTSYQNFKYNDKPEPLENLTRINDSDFKNKNQVCVLVNGIAKQAGPDEAHTTQDKQLRNLIGLIQTYQPDRLNMVGHSRGAVTCLRIAKNIEGKPLPVGLKCNIFCIDPVAWISYMGGKDYTLTANVSEYKRIAMEDDAPINTSVFPIMTIKSINGGYQIQPIDNIRLPGTHGTATQCNPILKAGENAAQHSSTNRKWPIGHSTYIMINKQLDSWETIMGQDFSDFDLIDNYAAIVNNNPGHYEYSSIGGWSLKRTVNNLDPCLPDKKVVQKIDTRVSKRSHEELDSLCPNPYQGGPLFINQQHYNLFQKNFPKITKLIPNDFMKVKYFDLSDAQKKAHRKAFFTGIKGSVKSDLVRLGLNCPTMSMLLDSVCYETLQID